MRCNFAVITGLLAGLASPSVLGQEALVDLGALTCTLVEPQAKAGEAEQGGQFRYGRCTFKPLKGPEEIYDAKVEGVSLTPTDGAKTVMWVVKGPLATALEPALLEQHYEADRRARDDAMAVLLGVANPQLALHHMADKPEGHASAPTKPRPTGFVILRLELNLKAASG